MTEPTKVLVRKVNRAQMFWRAVDVEKLVAEDHAARAIWEFVGRLDLSRYYQAIESSAEVGGRPAFDPQLLISLWAVPPLRVRPSWDRRQLATVPCPHFFAGAMR